MLKLNTAVKKIQSGRISWIPEDKKEEVENDLKCACFDYIRLNAKSNEGFDFRAIASSGGGNFLANEDVWNAFIENWKKATLSVKEESIDDVLAKASNAGDSDRLLEARDSAWRKQVGESLMEGFSEAKDTVDNKKEQEKPGVLIKRAINALDQVNVENLPNSKDKASIKVQLAKLGAVYKMIVEALN